MIIPTLEEDLDGLGYLQRKDVDFVNKATDGVLLAHTVGDVPNMYVTSQAKMPSYSVTPSTSSIGHRSFRLLERPDPLINQVLKHKRNTCLPLLGKPGFEELSKNSTLVYNRQQDLEKRSFF